jgi:hypothetical protein
VIRAATEQERQAIATHLGAVLTHAARGIVADSPIGIRGGVLFDNWTEGSAQVHMWSDSPIIWRRLLPEACRYVFLQAGRRVVVGIIRESNEASRATTEHMGFTLMGRLEDGAAPGEALLFYQLRRENCRYLNQHQKAA